MTKTRLIIYIVILIFIVSVSFIIIFSLVKKNNQTKNTTEITPAPLIEITWSEAVELIQNCKIKTIFQKRNLEVTLTHKDKRIFKTKEPEFNNVFAETNNLRSDCTDIIQTITE